MLDQNIMLLLSDAEIVKQKVLTTDVDDKSSVYFANPSDVVDTETIQYNNQESVGTIKHNEIDETIYAGQKYKIPSGQNIGRVIYASLEDQTKGNVTSSDVKPGKTIYVDGKKIIGNMKILNRIIIDSITYVDDRSFYISPLENAFYDSPVVSTCGISDYLRHTGIRDTDIKYGSYLYSISGTFASDANATENDVLDGNVFFTGDGKHVGTLKLDSLF